MNAKEIFSICPDFLGKTQTLGPVLGCEPNLWFMVFKYYAAHFSVDKATYFADQYMNAIQEAMDNG